MQHLRFHVRSAALTTGQRGCAYLLVAESAGIEIRVSWNDTLYAWRGCSVFCVVLATSVLQAWRFRLVKFASSGQIDWSGSAFGNVGRDQL
jgi:hypothetical protein